MTDENPAPSPPEPRPKGKRGPPRGRPQAGGRKPGQRNKATLAKEEAARIERERLEQIDALAKGGTPEAIAAVRTAGVKRGKDVLSELMVAFMGLTAMFQPWPNWVPKVDKNGQPVLDQNGEPVMRNANPNFDEARFDKYSSRALMAAAAVAPFHDPRYSAMMVGATVVNKIEVVGGMPDDFKAPAQVEFKPGTVITPDDVVDVPPEPARPKAVNE
jgi:hypothetical protein